MSTEERVYISYRLWDEAIFQYTDFSGPTSLTVDEVRITFQGKAPLAILIGIRVY